MKVLTKWIQRSNCFVDLSVSCTQEILNQLNTPMTQSICLKLQYQQSIVYVAWAGHTINKDAKIIAIPQYLAQVLNIDDDVFVNINIVHTSGTINNAIQIEPETVNDWEILSLNAEYIEYHLLSASGFLF